MNVARPMALALALALSTLPACQKHMAQDDGAQGASATTLAANEALRKTLPLDDPQDFEDAQRGLIARPSGQLLAADGTVLKDFDAYGFLQGPAPDTANPSLWRHAQLNAQTGLFKVMDGVYQVRGVDLANLTLIEGHSGWIVVDALTSRESAAFAMAFAQKYLGHKPVTALVLTHAHVDHFGGALGVLSPQDIAQRKVPVVAPDGFIEEATSENVLAGTAMGRRSLYQFGRDLPRNAKGNIDTGLGKDVVYGSVGIVMPSVLISHATQTLVLDGLQFVFHNVPSAESPAELTFSIPEKRLYDGAENLSQTMHNLLPLRGAKVRDALRWAHYLDQALEQVREADVYIASHNWPIWGTARIRQFITSHRDVYKYTHDQTLRLLNAGYTANEIADQVRLPDSLAQTMSARGHYGDLRHNVKAVYQHYIGFYDGNPAHLDPLPPADAAKRYVQLMGGANKVMAAAQTAYEQGEYRWGAELLNQLVSADASHQTAKVLLARTYEQMGYMAESATWRNAYLSGAQELREGPPQQGVNKALVIDMLLQTPTERFLEAMAASLNGPKAEGMNLHINLILTDTRESYLLWIENAVLHFRKTPPLKEADASLSLSKNFFIRMMAGTAGATDLLLSPEVQVSGSTLDLARFFSLLDKAPGNFPIVTR